MVKREIKMTSLKNLISKGNKNEKSTDATEQIKNPPKSTKLQLGIKSTSEHAAKQSALHIEKHSDTPINSLKAALSNKESEPQVHPIRPTDSASTPSEPSNETDSPISISNPTLEDVEKFVFEEQPDESTEEITYKFTEMLNELASSLGNDVPYNLERCLNFIKEHAFLADILKPESIATLVSSMRIAYGYVVKVQSEKQIKSTKRKEKLAEVSNDLADLKLF